MKYIIIDLEGTSSEVTEKELVKNFLQAIKANKNIDICIETINDQKQITFSNIF